MDELKSEILCSYNNSLAVMAELDKTSAEYQIEFGKAFAYEQILRKMGMDIYDVARIYWKGGDYKEEAYVYRSH